MKQSAQAAASGAWSKEKEATAQFHTNNITEINTLREKLNNALDADTAETINKQISELKIKRKVETDVLYQLYYPPQNASFKSAGRLILEDSETASIVKNGHFGVDRGAHRHAGTDYAMPEGS